MMTVGQLNRRFNSLRNQENRTQERIAYWRSTLQAVRDERKDVAFLIRTAKKNGGRLPQDSSY